VAQRGGASEAAASLSQAGPSATDRRDARHAERLKWTGNNARHALGEIYDMIKRKQTTLG